jgi:hypothetical protein
MCVCICICIYKCRNAGLYGIRSVRYRNKQNDSPVQYRIKPAQTGIFLVQYWTETMDAGKPMPALVSSKPVPNYGHNFVAR